MNGCRRLLLLALAVAFISCNGADEVGKFEVFIGGENEVCATGESCGGDGIGQASLDIDPEAAELCYDLDLEDIPDPVAAHIHRGTLEQTGEVAVDLAWEGSGPGARKCLMDLDPGLLTDIVENPRLYYLNVHSEAFPDGAARGHLST
jgi:hypothetical protein